ncbi:primosomal protein N' [Demequina capsici]|uniref:Primosomal protein N n=1 Tax=Demequina capsici TaxID=3075620 RepID=A0AA96FC38_9MICO|nr:primosomal protein N' [Demequina sp. OYTSA14]WNM25796.1 primosomal protein N' [Demequina sp. OYTSA14]
MPESDKPANRVARVVIDSPLPHLDRPFDYLLPERLARVESGYRVRVPFAGRLVSGVVMDVVRQSEFSGSLREVRSAAHAASYTPESLALAHALARRACGSTWDVLRLMAPPRVAAVEKRPPEGEVDLRRLVDAARALGDARGTHATGASSGAVAQARTTLAAGQRRPMRTVRQMLPDGDSPSATPARSLAKEAAEAAGEGRGSVIVVVPDARAAAAVARAWRAAGLERWTPRGGGDFVALDADDGPNVRYGQYLAALRGEVRLVVGTRPAALQPVPRLGLLLLWDDGHSAYEDPHAPYLHARTVASVRAEREDCDLIMAAYAPSIEAVALAQHGWCTLERPSAAQIRAATPVIDLWDDSRRAAEGPAGRHWMPPGVWRRVRAALEHGPVAVVVPRAGYVAATACARCDTWAQCRECGGSLSLPGRQGDPSCVACGTVQVDWHCPDCHSRRLAHRRQGVQRVAEQLEAMAPGTAVAVSSGATGVLDDGAAVSGVVVATPGAIPAIEGGYAHVVVLDAAAPAGGLGGEIVALRHWLVAAAHARSRAAHGGVSVVGELPALTARALSSWQAADAAQEAYEERLALGLPPATRHIRIDGEPQPVHAALVRVGADRGGAVVAPDHQGASLLLTRASAQACVDALREVCSEQSKAGAALIRVRVDGPLRLA